MSWRALLTGAAGPGQGASLSPALPLGAGDFGSSADLSMFLGTAQSHSGRKGESRMHRAGPRFPRLLSQQASFLLLVPTKISMSMARLLPGYRRVNTPRLTIDHSSPVDRTSRPLRLATWLPRRSRYLTVDGPGADSVTGSGAGSDIREATALSGRHEALDGTLPLCIIHLR